MDFSNILVLSDPWERLQMPVKIQQCCELKTSSDHCLNFYILTCQIQIRIQFFYFDSSAFSKNSVTCSLYQQDDLLEADNWNSNETGGTVQTRLVN